MGGVRVFSHKQISFLLTCFYVNWRVNSITVEEWFPGVLNSPEPGQSWKAIRKPGALPWLHSYSCRACSKELGITSTYLIHLISKMVYRHILFHSVDLNTCVRISESKHLLFNQQNNSNFERIQIKLSFTCNKNSELLFLH